MIRSQPAATKREVGAYLVWALAWLAITAVGLVLVPHPDGHGTHRQLGFPPCPTVLLFSRPCPGCGLTTSWTATLHGMWPEAFRAHPLGPILYLGFTASAFLSMWAWFKQRYFVYSTAFYRVSWTVVGVLLAVTVVRFINPPASYSANPFAPVKNDPR